jgi:hypothetical protein
MSCPPPRRTGSVLLALTLASCTGVLDSPRGPSDSDWDGKPGDGTNTGHANDPSSSGDDGDGAAGIGTAVIALCEDTSKEQPGPRLLRLMTRREYRNTVQDLLFVAAPDISSLPLEPRVRGYDDNAAQAAITSRHLDAYSDLGDSLAQTAVQDHKDKLLSCDPSDASCARTFVSKFLLRAFRRPASTEELDRYAALFDSALTQGDFDEGMRLVIKAALLSPSFLYRSEVGEAQGDGTFALTQYEIASALSYLYWASMPDDTLFESAAQNKLDTQKALEDEAKRLLEDARARDQLGEFSLQWLGSYKTVDANKDMTIYPAFNADVRVAMLEEQRRFVTETVLDEGGTFADLFVSDHIVANGTLAGFYGLSGASSDYSHIKVTPDSGRGGLLGLGAVLAAQAHSNESSPIKRGLFVRDRLLCQNLPPPPANLDTTPPGLDPNLTTRERFAKHTSDKACHSCHQYIDGVGFGFEGFDGVGARRSQENGHAVDESGDILGLEGIDKKSDDKFDGLNDLAALLVDSKSAQACLSLQYFRFARGYEERKSDACSLAALQERFDKSNLTVKELLIALPTLKSFVIRKD